VEPDARLEPLLARWASAARRAVIFDFNGTLSNDEPILLRLFTALFAERLDLELTEEVYFEHLAGRSDREIVEWAVAQSGRDQAGLVDELLAERAQRYRELVEVRSPIEPESRALVELLSRREIPMAVVTGAQLADVDMVLGHAGLRDRFVAVISEEDVVDGKPHPEGFLHGASALGVPAGSVLVFEDSLFGIRAAKAAGMICVGVRGTSEPGALRAEADAVVDALDPQPVARSLDAAR
jgi:beta-phosphoglucomutase